jgi:membrane protease YdiL (CAAX protease family)
MDKIIPKLNLNDNKKKAIYALFYAIFALTIDSISTIHLKWGIDWGIFYWQLKNGFEVSTFILWFAIPFVFTYKSIDWKYFGVSRLKKSDIYFVILLSILGMIAVLSIKFFPSLRSFYPSMAFQNASAKLNWALYKMIWNMSWLTGWEFLHRYVLLTCFEKAFPKKGWFGVCLIEFVFHFQKAFLEAIGMLIFSVIVTYWAYKRKNIILPFFSHLLIESFLLLLILFE